MARPEGITFRGSDYLPDWGDPGTPLKYKYTFKVPDGLSNGAINDIINEVGGTIVDKDSSSVPCDDAEGYPWTPRKLRFWFASGKSVSIPVPTKVDLVGTSFAIATALSSVAEIVCVGLEGETWRNIMDLIEPSTSNLPPTAMEIAETAAGEKELSYVGSMSYEADGTTEMLKAFKMATNVAENAPYAQYAGAIDSCLIAGGPINTGPARCPGFKQVTFDHRRFRVVMLQNRRVISGEDGDATSEVSFAKSEMLVPMGSRTPADIRACALALRAVPHTMCLGYRGEWDKRFSSKNPGSIP